MDATPERLLGLPVLGPHGNRIGTVVDVGLYNWRQPKFLLVQAERPGTGNLPGAQALLRVEIGQVLAFDETAVRLAPIEERAPLPT